MKHIIVIEGGFAGNKFLRNFDHQKDFHFPLIDRDNYNFFPPLLCQVAMGFHEPSSISYPPHQRFIFTGAVILLEALALMTPFWDVA